MSIAEFDNVTYRALSKEINEALAAIAAKHSIKIGVAGGKLGIGAKNLEIKLALSVVENGKVVSKEAEAFKRYAKLEGLEPTDLGRQFTFTARGRKETYKITGYATKAKQYPILAEGPDGRTYKFDVSDVKRGLI